MKRSLPPDTDRLSFRLWQEGDLDAFHDLCSDLRVMQFVGDGEPWSRERAEQFVQHALDTLRQHGYCQWALIHKADQTLVGYCGFVEGDQGPEIGWRLSPRYWGRGLATEAARAALNHGFEILGFQQVFATVQAANAASIRVVEKLGMMLVESFQRHGREVLLFRTTGDQVPPGRRSRT